MGSHIPKASLDGENRWVYLHDTFPIPLNTVFDTRDNVICAPTVDRFMTSNSFIDVALFLRLKADHTTGEMLFVYRRIEQRALGIVPFTKGSWNHNLRMELAWFACPEDPNPSF